jgi:hypothetical protein
LPAIVGEDDEGVDELASGVQAPLVRRQGQAVGILKQSADGFV